MTRPGDQPFQYAVVRVVPHVERGDVVLISIQVVPAFVDLKTCPPPKPE